MSEATTPLVTSSTGGVSCPDIYHAVNINDDAKDNNKSDLSTDYYTKLNGKLNSQDLSIDLTLLDETAGQKCFGEKSDVERVLDSKCPCLRSKCLHWASTILFVLFTAVVLVFFFRRYLKELLAWLQHAQGWLSGLLFVLMFTVVSLPMTWGYIVLNVAAGYLYGFFAGLLTVVVSVLIGVAVSLVVCRKVIRGFVQSKLQSEHLKAIIRVVESRRGFKVVLLTRLTPIPFGLQNGLFAITNMSLSKCLLASFFGLLPTQALNAYLGSSLRTMEDVVHHNSAGGYLLLLVQVGISAFLMWYVIRRARYELNKACLPTEYERTIDELVASQTQTSRPLAHSRVASGMFSDYRAVPTQEHESADVKGHKRAHSASAILYALQNSHLEQD